RLDGQFRLTGERVPLENLLDSRGKLAERPETQLGLGRHEWEDLAESRLSLVKFRPTGSGLIQHAPGAVEDDHDRASPGAEAGDDLLASAHGDAGVGRIAGRWSDRDGIGNGMDRHGCRPGELLAP